MPDASEALLHPSRCGDGGHFVPGSLRAVCRRRARTWLGSSRSSLSADSEREPTFQAFPTSRFSYPRLRDGSLGLRGGGGEGRRLTWPP